jgi:hypothetical protein
MHSIRLQETFRRRKALHPPSDGADQILQRTPESIVIVDNPNQRVFGVQSLLLLFNLSRRLRTVEPITMAVLVWTGTASGKKQAKLCGKNF